MLDSALGWIGQIAGWVGNFIPRWYINDTTMGAVKYVRGQPHRCDAGQIHWIWPATTTIVFYPIARQTDRLETQTIESSDGKTFLVSGTITYEVDNIMQLVPTTHSPVATIADLAMTAVHDVCCDMDWETLQREQRKGTLKTKLRNEAQRQLKDYGVRVLKLQLNSLARCRVLRVSQTTGSEES
jgi:regulator of protease activity HflC (stomatin/prohibitin superfamily)